MVMRKSEAGSCRQVEERLESFTGESAGAGPSMPTQTRDVDGNPCISKVTCPVGRHFKLRGKVKKENGYNSLSDINDAEIVGYLNTKDEVQLKRLLWEAMNRKHAKLQVKKKVPIKDMKKGASVRKAASTVDKVESLRQSTRINYDALNFLEDELEKQEKGGEEPQKPSEDSKTQDEWFDELEF